MDIQQTSFITAVEQGFYANLRVDQDLKQQIQKTTITAFMTDEKTEEVAKNILADFPQLNPSTSSKRYRFKTLSSRESLLHAIFKRSFAQNSDSLIGAAEKADQKLYYSRWKKVFVINFYQGVAAVTGHKLFGLAVTIAGLIVSYQMLSASYTATSAWVSARGIPLFINHTPIQVIRAGNWILDMKDWVRKKASQVILYVFLANIVLGNQAATSFLGRAGIFISVVTRSPQTVFLFLFKTCLGSAFFFYNTSKEVSLFFNKWYHAAENERLSICQKKTFALWQQAIAH